MYLPRNVRQFLLLESIPDLERHFAIIPCIHYLLRTLWAQNMVAFVLVYLS